MIFMIFSGLDILIIMMAKMIKIFTHICFERTDGFLSVSSARTHPPQTNNFLSWAPAH